MSRREYSPYEDCYASDQEDDYEHYGSHRYDRVEREDSEVEGRGDPREHHRSGHPDRGEKRRRHSFGHRYLAQMMEGLRDTMLELAKAVRLRNRRSKSLAQLQQSQPHAAGTKRMAAMREFQRLHPPHFRGEADPLAAEEWLKSMNRHLDVLGIEDGEQRVSLVVFHLTDNAGNWWDVANQSVGDNWEQFEEAFRNQYVPESEVEKLRRQFEGFTQGDMSINKYAQQFINLSRFAPDRVTDEGRRCRRFERGLRPPLRDRVVTHRFRDFSSLLKAAKVAEKNWETFRKERESKKPKGAGTSKGGRQGQKRKSFSPEFGREVLKRSRNVGSSIGSRRSISSRPLACHLCDQPGHIMSRCPKLQQARASVSGPQPQQQRSRGSRLVGQGSAVCYRCGESGHIATSCPASVTCYNCGQPGHTHRDCPIRPDSSQRTSTGQTSRAPAQSSRGGEQQRGRMAALEMVEELNGYRGQPAQVIQYVYPLPTQPSQGGRGGGGVTGQDRGRRWEL